MHTDPRGDLRISMNSPNRLPKALNKTLRSDANIISFSAESGGWYDLNVRS